MKSVVRWTAIVALFTIPFLPLYVSGELFFPFITGKNFAFRILVEIAAGSWLLLALMDRRYRPRFSWPLALFAGLVAWMAVADLLGVLPHKAFWSNFERMDGWIMLVHVFLLFLVAGTVLTVEKLWRKWWLFFLSVAALVCGYGIIQAVGGATIHQGGVRLDATFGNAIYLAAYLMFSILIAAWLFVTSKGGMRYALAGSAALSLVVLLFTASRGPVIGLVAGIMVASGLWLVLGLRDKGASNKAGLKIAAGTLAALVVVIGSFFLIRDSAFVQGTAALQRLSSVFTLSEELEVRSTIWGIALEGVKEDPLTGWGQEGFNQIFNKYYEPSLYAQESWFDRAHNMYIDWLVAGGIPALALFVALLVAGSLALLATGRYTRAERVLLIGALAAYAVQALVVFDNLFSYVPLAMLLAMAHASGARPVERLDALPELRSDTAIASASAGIAVVTLIIIWTVNVPGIRAAHHVVYAVSPAPSVDRNIALFKDALDDGSFASQEIREQLVIFASRIAPDSRLPESTRSSLLTLAINEMGKEVAYSPNDARLRVQYAGAFEAAGFKEESLRELDAALALSPRKQALHINRGFKLQELGRTQEAKEAFQTAYDLDPSFDQVAVSVAAGYLMNGDVAAAKALLIEAVGTTTPNSDSLFYAYYQTKQWDELIAVARARVREENGSAESRYRLAQAFAAASRFEEARLEISLTMATFPATKAQGTALMNQIFQPAR